MIRKKNIVALDLRTPKYRKRVVANKKAYNRKKVRLDSNLKFRCSNGLTFNSKYYKVNPYKSNESHMKGISMKVQFAGNDNSESSGPGRRRIFDDDVKLVTLLSNIAAGNAKLTNYMKHQLMDAEYLTVEVINPVGRGRPTEKPILTGKARSLVGLSKTPSWRKKMNLPPLAA